MTIIGITGEIGAGKSLEQLRFSLELCQKRHRKLVTNFALNLTAVKKYGQLTKQPWVTWLADNNQIACVDTIANLPELLKDRKNCVIALDEAGIFLNARDFAKTPKSLLMDLAQSRKCGNDLIWAAQFDDQVDKQFRKLTQFFIFATGFSVHDEKLGIPRLKLKQYWHFKPTQYWHCQTNMKIMNSFIRKWLNCNKLVQGPLTEVDRLLFQCFDSKARLDQQAANVQEFKPSHDFLDEYLNPDVSFAFTSGLSQRQSIARSQRLFQAIADAPPPLRFLYGRDYKRFRKYSF